MRLFAVPPLDPDPSEARRWLEDELSKNIYHRQPSLLERLIDWVQGLFDQMPGFGALPPWQAFAVGLAAVAVIVLIAWRVAGPMRRRIAARAPGPVLGEEQRSAQELRAAARERAAAGDWRAASILAFQAMARRLEDRVILDRRPGRTADELAADAARLLPALAASLGSAADQFDAIAYGNARGDERVYQFFVDLDAQADAAKPLAEVVAA
ncbi:MAG: DUF4129 domain-containing protein [Bifidobacteriaceae bacterium]|jgi:hypothetical protein|nr:DUF4129 domain-containing protein [Bifidobacteriaceae bacterium]